MSHIATWFFTFNFYIYYYLMVLYVIYYINYLLRVYVLGLLHLYVLYFNCLIQFTTICCFASK